MTPADLSPLHALGVSAAQERVYELVIARPSATLTELSAVWSRPESLADCLAALTEHGLVRVLAGPPAEYVAVAPDIALDDLLIQQEQRLRRARGYADVLAAIHSRQSAGDALGTVVEVVTGEAAIRQRINQIQRGTRTEIRLLARLPQDWADAPLSALANGVTCRGLFDRIAVTGGGLPEIANLIGAGLSARTLPELPMRFYLADDRFGILPLRSHDPEASTSDAVVVVHRSLLLVALGDLFEQLWQRALPLDPGRLSATVDDQQLIGLLLSGLTDVAIARQLGLGYRTVQRRIADLIDRLGVHSRFQAGVQAALRERSP